MIRVFSTITRVFSLIIEFFVRYFWGILITLFVLSFVFPEIFPPIFLSVFVFFLFIRSDIKKYKLKQLIEAKVALHEDVLCKKYNQLVYQDDYGKMKTDAFKRECRYFIKNVLFTDPEVLDALKIKNSKINRKGLRVLEDALCADIELKISQHSQPRVKLSYSTPYDFENYCAQKLKDRGWNAHVTQKSLDQGVDVVAEKNGKKIAIQCKLYNRPVGNKAVQEVNAGKNYYQAEYAAVVTTSSYTSSAHQLAKNCNILLLTIDDLNNLEELIDM